MTIVCQDHAVMDVDKVICFDIRDLNFISAESKASHLIYILNCRSLMLNEICRSVELRLGCWYLCMK